MNGDFTELYNKLKTDHEIFAAVMEERWKNHSERGEKIDKKIEGIFNKFDRLPCGKREGFYSSTINQLRAIWAIMTGVILVGLFKIFVS